VGAHTEVSELFTDTYNERQGHGIPIGSFLLLPSVGAYLSHDDDVFAADSSQLDDFTLTVAPELRLLSQWSQHSVELLAGLRGNFYDEYSSENVENYYVGGRARIDILHDLKLRGEVRYESAHEARGTGYSFAPFMEPAGYEQLDAEVSVSKRFNRLWTETGGTLRQNEFRPVEIKGSIVPQDARDETRYEAYNRTGYELSARTSIYGEVARVWTDFHGHEYDGDGYRLLAGIRYELTRLTRADVAVGVLEHDFDQPGIKDVDAWTWRAQVFWNPTPLTQIVLSGRRDIGVADFYSNDSSRLASEVGLRADYDIRRDVRLTGIIGYQWIEYGNLDLDEDMLSAAAGIEYFFDPVWSLLLTTTYQNFDRSTAGEDYDKTVTMVGARGRL
jgi:hypothetical protein